MTKAKKSTSSDGLAVPGTLPTPSGSGLEGDPSARRPWASVHSWTIWLDNPDLTQLSKTKFDLAVIDYSADGSAQQAFTAAQVAALRQSSCQRRVVAYLSIGQAESYRGYWQKGWTQGHPGWLGAQDPDWNGNYWVDFWDLAWQQIIYSYLDEIIAAGFDGVYLDRVDAYQEECIAGHENDMVRFVMDIACYARTHSPLGSDFGVFVQNAEELAADHNDYVRAVTGIGREEVYVRAMNEPTTTEDRSQAEHYLDLFGQYSQAQLVLTIDYATHIGLVNEVYQQARAKGYVPYVTTVDLSHL
jgi:cysteinyl-tRNA synthetase